jgi:hypothetical protein
MVIKMGRWKKYISFCEQFNKYVLTLLVRSISAVVRIEGNHVMFHNRRYVCATPKFGSACMCLSAEEYSFLKIAINVVENRKIIPQKYRKPTTQEKHTSNVTTSLHCKYLTEQ